MEAQRLLKSSAHSCELAQETAAASDALLQDKVTIPSRHFDLTQARFGDEQKNEKPQNENIHKRAFVFINIVVILFTCSMRMNILLLNQFLYHVYTNDALGDSGIHVDTTNTPCGESGMSSSNQSSLVQQAQADTAEYIFQLDLIMYTLSVVTSTFLGIFSVHISRKVQILLPTIGLVTLSMTLTLVIYLKADVWWLLFGALIEGISGGRCGLFTGYFLYASDVTPRNRKRTVGMTILEGVRGITGAAVNIMVGHVLKEVGFLVPACFCAGSALCAAAFVCILPDHKPKVVVRKSVSIRDTVKGMLFPFFTSQEQRIVQIVLLILVGFLVIFIERFSTLKIMLLYLMNTPFCWDAATIGWFLSSRELGFNICSVLVIKFLSRHLPGYSLGIMGAMMTMAAWMMCAFAHRDLDLYMVALLSVGYSLPVSIMRGETSQLLEPQHQASFFARLAVVENIGCVFGSLSITVYKNSLGMFQGLVFLEMAVFMFSIALILTMVHSLWRKHSIQKFSKDLFYETESD